MKRKKEQSAIDGFFKHFHRAAEKMNRRAVNCSMDGMDTILGADYIFTDNVTFALTEFKHDEKDLKSEAEKHRRESLCIALDSDVIKANLANQCHYISWTKKTEELRRVIYFNKYKHQICNRTIFGDESNLKNDKPSVKPMPAREFISLFLQHKIGTNFELFNHYVEWLLEREEEDSGVEILLDDPDDENCGLIEFESLSELRGWLSKYTPTPPAPTPPKSGMRPR
ncbi:hypothetical protein [Vibrio furnissii]|uniref:hypothetical protein n=1 Tax=Vibrio furnissii TaxID=29494 RepID=UPI000571E77B|nr:hypothetical protein [Vibrio furnissii]QDC95466.1 hypothetical protein FIU11_22610 [Vibrio furnissii]UON50895.1 hypothetical protein IUJ52_18215 [Vibrio furnissii]SUQ33207.1 Uncharacterised protein [Vibrio furnissii]